MNEQDQNNQAWPENPNQGYSQSPGETPPPPPEWEDSRYESEPQNPYRDDYDSSEPRPTWELRDEIGWFSAGLSSLKEILLDPEVTFRRMPLVGGIGGPLLFLVIIGFIGMTGSTLWSILWNLMFTPLQVAAQSRNPHQELAFVTTMFGSIYFQLVMLFVSPILITITAFISAGIYHLLLMLFGGATQEFEATMRVVCYSSGATSIFNAIPFLCGSAFITLIWGIVCTTIGLREAHQCSTIKAFLVVMLPITVCCCCVFLFFSVFAAAGFTALANS